MGNARVLVVEDEPTIRSSVAAALRADGHDVEELASGEHLERTLAAYRPSVVVLDWMLPGRDGPALARVVRGSGDIGIIMLTAREDVDDRLRAFAVGVDDYVPKPFAMAELVARVRALLHRVGAIPATLRIGDLVVDEAGGQGVARRRRAAAHRDRVPAAAYLAANRGRVVSGTQILTQVWGYEDYSDNLVQATLSTLRRKMEEHGPRLVHTVRGLGYVLRTHPVTTSTPSLHTPSLRRRVTLVVLVLLAVMLALLGVTTTLVLGKRLEAQLEQRLAERAESGSPRQPLDPSDLAKRSGGQRHLGAAAHQRRTGVRRGPPPPKAPGPGAKAPPPVAGATTPVTRSGDTLEVSRSVGSGATLLLTADAGRHAAHRRAGADRAPGRGPGGAGRRRPRARPRRRRRAAAPRPHHRPRPVDPPGRPRRAAAARPAGHRAGREPPQAFDEMLDAVGGRREARARTSEAAPARFLADAAHELRTPLAGIAAVAETVTARRTSRPREREEYATLLVRDSRRAGRLVEGMLTLARLDGGVELDVADGRPGRARAPRGGESPAPARRADVCSPPPRPPSGSTRSSIGQAVSNLVTNARRARRRAGHRRRRADRPDGRAHGRATRARASRPPTGSACSSGWSGSTRPARAVGAGPVSGWRSPGRPRGPTAATWSASSRPGTTGAVFVLTVPVAGVDGRRHRVEADA